MSSLEDHKLEYIRVNTLLNDDINQLIQEKKEALDGIPKSTSGPSKAPHLTPKGDIYIPRKDTSKGLSGEDYQKEYERVTDTYNQKIFDTTKTHFEKDMPEGDVQLIEELGKDNLNLLLEDDGMNKVIEKQKQEEVNKTAKEEAIDKNPARLDAIDNRELMGEMEPEVDSLEIIDKDDKTISSTKEIEQPATMDKEESREVFDNYDRKDYFEDNKKSMDIDKNPSPNDDYE